MAKEFAKKFYRSKAWQSCRNMYFQSQHGICELCGAPGEEVHHKKALTPNNITDLEIALGGDNLQLLCKTCHSAIHEKSYQMYRKRHRTNTGLANGLCFDEDGNVVQKKNVFIVWGAPASGKTTYVKEQKGKYDLVVDLDYIMCALSLEQGKNYSEDALPFALDIRDYIYQMIQERRHFFENMFIVSTLPKKEQREALAKRLNGTLIHINTGEEECLKRARRDTERKNKELQYKIIKEFFETVEV